MPKNQTGSSAQGFQGGSTTAHVINKSLIFPPKNIAKMKTEVTKNPSRRTIWSTKLWIHDHGKITAAQCFKAFQDPISLLFVALNCKKNTDDRMICSSWDYTTSGRALWVSLTPLVVGGLPTPAPNKMDGDQKNKPLMKIFKSNQIKMGSPGHFPTPFVREPITFHQGNPPKKT